MLSEGLLDFVWSDDRGDALMRGYRYIRTIPEFFSAFPKQNDRFKRYAGEFDSINQISGGARVAITRQWAVSYRIAYSFERELLLTNSASIEYVSRCGCWSAGVVLGQSRSRGLSLSFRYSVLGLGNDSRWGMAPAPLGAGSLLDSFRGV